MTSMKMNPLINEHNCIENLMLEGGEHKEPRIAL
jgi:hypothetical protein